MDACELRDGCKAFAIHPRDWRVVTVTVEIVTDTRVQPAGWESSLRIEDVYATEAEATNAMCRQLADSIGSLSHELHARRELLRFHEGKRCPDLASTVRDAAAEMVA